MGRNGRKLEPLRTEVLSGEVLAHIVMLSAVWPGGAGYVGLLLLLALEILLVNLLSIPLYPERGARRHVWDVIKLLLALGFLVGFALLGAGLGLAAVNATEDDPLRLVGAAIEALDMRALTWMAAATALHLGLWHWRARRAPDPRRAWAGAALTQGACTLVTLLLLALLGVFLAAPLAYAGAALDGERGAQLALALPAVSLRCALAVLVARMPEQDLQDIARRPYVE